MEEITAEDQENVIVINDSNSEDCLVNPTINEEIAENHEEIIGNTTEKQVHTNMVLEEAPTLIKNTIKQLIVDRVTKQIETKIINDQNDIQKEYNKYLDVKKQKLKDYVVDLQQKINSDNDTMTTIKSSLQQSNGLIQFLNQQIENIEQRKFDNRNRLEIIKTKFSSLQKQENVFQQNYTNRKNTIIGKFQQDRNYHDDKIINDLGILNDYKKQLWENQRNVNDLKQKNEAIENQIKKQLEEKKIIEDNLLTTKNNLLDSCSQKEKELQVQNDAIIAITNQIGAFKEKLLSSTDKIQELKSIHHQKENSVDDLKKAMEDLLEIFEEKRRNGDEIRLAIQNIDESFAISENDYKKCLQEKESELKIVEDELTISQELYNKQTTEIETLEKDNAEKLKIKDSLAAEIGNYRTTLANHRQKVELLKEEQATKQEILQDLQKQRDEIEEKLKTLNEEIIKQQNYNDEQIKIASTKLEISIANNNQIVDHLTNFKKSKIEKSQQLDREIQEMLPVLKKSEQFTDELLKENNETKLKIQKKLNDLNQLRSVVKKLSKTRYRSTGNLSRSLNESEVSATRKVRFDETVYIKSATEESDSQELSQQKENSSVGKNLELK